VFSTGFFAVESQAGSRDNASYCASGVHGQHSISGGGWSEMQMRPGEEAGPGPQARSTPASDNSPQATPLLRIIYPENTVWQEP